MSVQCLSYKILHEDPGSIPTTNVQKNNQLQWYMFATSVPGRHKQEDLWVSKSSRSLCKISSQTRCVASKVLRPRLKLSSGIVLVSVYYQFITT